MFYQKKDIQIYRMYVSVEILIRIKSDTPDDKDLGIRYIINPMPF